MKTIKVLIVGDALQVREGLETVLTLAGNTEEPRIEVKGFARNGDEAVSQVLALQPDVVLMDMEMTGLDCNTTIKRVKAARSVVRVVILSIQNNAGARMRALASGADGYVVKGSEVEDLLKAVTGDGIAIRRYKIDGG